MLFTRQASIFLESAQYPGTPIKLQDGTTGIRASAKVKKTIEMCKGIVEEDNALPIEKGRKICIFKKWTSGFPVLQYHLLLAGLGSVTLSGSNTAQERDAIVQKLQQARPHLMDISGKEIRALRGDRRTKEQPHVLNSNALILSEAGGEGLNLTRISELIVLDGMSTPADEHQLEGRFARRGQERPLNIHYLKTPGNADEPMKLASQQKSTLYDITAIFATASLHDSIEETAGGLLKDFCTTEVDEGEPPVVPPSAPCDDTNDKDNSLDETTGNALSLDRGLQTTKLASDIQHFLSKCLAGFASTRTQF